jgi:3-oxoadipate enol-lactonase
MSTAPATDREVAIGDIRVAYTATGDGPPVVLVHGLAEDRRSWAPQQRELSAWRTIAYDLRGHGATTAGHGDGSLAQLGGDLVGLLEAVSGPATVAGFSLGGTIALWAAAERPDLVRQAVVLGTSSIVGRAAAAWYAERIALVREGDRDAIRQALREDTAAGLAGATVDVSALAERRLEAIGGGAGYVNAATAMASLHDEPLTPRLAAVRCHVDVVGGEHDAFCPRKAADVIVDALPDATYHEIPGTGHLMNAEAPDAVTSTLSRTLERTGSR